MSDFVTLCKESVVDFETRVEQPIQTMEAFGTDSVDVSLWELHVSLSQLGIVRPTNGAVSNGKERPSSKMVCLVARWAMD